MSTPADGGGRLSVVSDVGTREAVARHRCWLAKLQRYLAHQRVEAESQRTRELHRELHAVTARAQRLRRRARWLTRTKRPLPRDLGGGRR